MRFFGQIIHFKTLLGSFALMIPLFAHAGDAPGGRDLSCPTSTSASGVNAWRMRAAHWIADHDSSAHRIQLTHAIRTCFGNRTPDCLGALSRFAEDSGFLVKPYGELSLIRKATDFPKEFWVPSGTGQYRTGLIQVPKNLPALAKAKGWKFVLAKTRGSGGFAGLIGDMTAQVFGTGTLALVRVVGPQRDLFIQVNLPFSQGDGLGHGFTNPMPDSKSLSGISQPQSGGVDTVMAVISIDKTQQPPVAHLATLSKVDGSQNQFALSSQFENQSDALDADNTLRTCQTCHANPLKTYSPVGFHAVHGTEGQMSPEQEKSIEEMNQAIQDYGKISWGSLLANGKPMNFAQRAEQVPLGWAPEGSQFKNLDYVSRCAKLNLLYRFRAEAGGYHQTFKISNPSKIRPAIIAQSLNCVSCHDGKSVGVLGPNYNFMNVEVRVLLDHSMPMGVDLTEDERIGLLNCLKEEASEQSTAARQAQWLVRDACE